MQKLKAFTLIELLVVIAIIAILAAILFPVFAQAKAAAKKSVSISNIKQTALGVIMYGSDVDDTVVDITVWGGGAADVAFGGVACNPWPLLINPYTKSADILVDPQAPANVVMPAGFNPQDNKFFGPEYGMNPYLIQSATYPLDPNGSALLPRNFSSISRTSDIVLLSQKYSNSETVGTRFYGYYWYGPGTFFITLTVDPPDCQAPGNYYYCAGGWNLNGFYGGPGSTNYLSGVEAAGAWTGGASMRGPKKTVTAFVDGHVQSVAPGVLATGTTYSYSIGANNQPTQNASSIVVNNVGIEHYYGIK